MKYADVWQEASQDIGVNGWRILNTPKYRKVIARTEEKLVGDAGMFAEITYYNADGEIVAESTACPRGNHPIIGEHVIIERPKRIVSSEKYDKANTKQVKMKLNLNTDADIIEKLNSVDNVQGYIKALIRADLNK